MVSKEDYCQYVERYANMVLRISVNYCKIIPDAVSTKPDSIAVKKDAKSDSILAKRDAKSVNLVYDSMEEYALGDKTGNGWYEFATNEGFKSGKEFAVDLLQVDVDTSKDYFVDDVSYSQNITVGDNRGIYI